MERRGFLAAAGGSALAAVSFLYPGVAKAARAATTGPRTVVPDPGLDPTFATGEVASITSEGVVLHTPTTARAVRLPAGTSVWKEFDLKPDVIELGDWVDVKGEPQTDGSLLATNGMVFVNIARKDGVIESVSSSGVSISNERGKHALGLSRALEVIRGSDGTPLARGLSDLAVGGAIGAVGVRLRDGSFRATRIWTVD
jgi:hypothetical protein